MSQIETIMSVALGFVLATLIALFVGRGMWVYAVKASKRRGERERPSDLARVQADRDQLRAEYAMLSRKLELRLGDLKTRLAEQTAEVSRNRNRVEHLVAEVEARDAALTAAAAGLDEANAQIEPLEVELAHRTQSLQRLKDQLRDRDETITALHQELADAHSLVAARDHQIDALRAAPAAPVARGRGKDTEAASTYERLSHRIEELNLLSQRIEAQREDLTQQHEALKALKADIVMPAKPRRKRKISANGKKGAVSPAARAASQDQDSSTARLEMEILQAARETDGLAQDLADLDRVWGERLASLGEAAPPTAAQAVAKSAAKAAGAAQPGEATQPDGDDSTNVISLASRIRALQKNIGE